MIVHLDTSLLVDAIGGSGGSRLREAAEAGHRLTFSTIVLFEWLRGPRTEEELALQTSLFPESTLAPVGPDAARTAARLYRTVKRPRTRGFDLVIAACAIEHGAALWTLNPQDFRDISELTLYPG